MNSLDQQLRDAALAWREAGLERQLSLDQGVDFCSNNYLGLAQDPRVLAAAVEAAKEYGVGAPAARLLHGNLAIHQQAEAEAAHWMGTEAALLFPSGWQANQALLTTFAGRDDVLFCDALNHASLIDGARLSRARVEIFGHNQMEALESLLACHHSARRRIVVVEDVYSMDGDRAPLAEILQLCQQHDAYVILDMAHSAGLFSPPSSENARILALMCTGGKALGLAGAFVCASNLVIQTLVNHGRSFVFTTAVPPMLAGGLRRAMQIVQAEPERAQTTFARAQELRQQLKDHGISCGGESPILPIILGHSQDAMATAEKLQQRGHLVRAVRPPTVPEGSSRLRIVVHSNHSPAEIQALATDLAAITKRLQRKQSLHVATPTPTPLVVCGTDTNVGKTVVSALLVRASLQAGQATRYLKPIQTGMDSDTDAVVEMARMDPQCVEAPLFHFPLPASVDQAAADAGEVVQVDAVLARTQQKLASLPQAQWILETAGGLLVPWNTEEDQGDYLRRLGAPCVLVARSGLGTLNHTLLTMEALRARRIPLRALFLVGKIHPQNRNSIQARHPQLTIFELPLFKTLSRQHLDLWLDAEPAIQQLWSTHARS